MRVTRAVALALLVGASVVAQGAEGLTPRARLVARIAWRATATLPLSTSPREPAPAEVVGRATRVVLDRLRAATDREETLVSLMAVAHLAVDRAAASTAIGARLADADAEVGATAALALGLVGDEHAAADLAAASASEAGRVARFAALGLGLLAARVPEARATAIAALRAVLERPRAAEDLQLSACMALCAIATADGVGAGDAEMACDALWCRYVRDDPESLRGAIAPMLAASARGLALRERVEERMRSDAQTPALAIECTIALGILTPDAAIDTLPAGDALEHALALVEVGGAEAQRVLVDRFLAKSPFGRVDAALMLGLLRDRVGGSLAPPLHATVGAALVEMVERPWWRDDRALAAFALLAHERTRPVVEEKLRTVSDSNISILAVVLARTGSSSANESTRVALRERWSKGSDAVPRVHLLHALMVLGNADAAKELVDVLAQGGDGGAARWAAAALADHGPWTALLPLVALVERSESPFTRAWAIAAIGGIASAGNRRWADPLARYAYPLDDRLEACLVGDAKTPGLLSLR